jgi:hypothetical protein
MLKSIEKKFNDFLYLSESKKPGLSAILESVGRHLEALNPRSIREQRAVRMALYELKQARLESRRMDERLRTLQEQIKVLEEGK